MEYLPSILAADDAHCEVINAFSFANDAAYLVVSTCSDDEELEASALLEVALGRAEPTYRVLHEFDSGSLDYRAEHAGLHHILASGGYLHRLEGDDMTLHPPATDSYVSKLAGFDGDAVLLYGDDGAVYRFANGAYTPLTTPTSDTLHALHFPEPGCGYAGGDGGLVLRSDGEQFISLELGSQDDLRAVFAKADGTLLLGAAGGIGLVYRDGLVTRIEGAPADLCSVTEFRGVEYWGDDDFGLHLRSGPIFVPTFEVGCAFNLNATRELLTVNGGSKIDLFDGDEWTHLRVNPSLEHLVERASLDFTPR